MGYMCLLRTIPQYMYVTWFQGSWFFIISGTVALCAGCNVYPAWAAVIIGAASGPLYLSFNWMLLRCQVSFGITIHKWNFDRTLKLFVIPLIIIHYNAIHKLCSRLRSWIVMILMSSELVPRQWIALILDNFVKNNSKYMGNSQIFQ